MRGNLRMHRDQARREDFSKSGSRAQFSAVNNKKECLLSEDLVTLMKEIFERLDKYEDLVVPRAQLIDALKKDVRLKKFMDKGVVYLPRVNKEIALRKVLQQIEHEEFIKADTLDAGDSNFVSSKKYISWKNFMDYFINYSKNKSMPDIDPEFKKDEGDDQDVIEIPRSLKEKIKSIFNEMKDEDGYVKSFDFLNRLKGEKIIIDNLETQIRTKAKYGEVPAEKLRETISRIENTIDDYTDWDEFIQYFTKRGVPVKVEEQKRIPQLSHVVAPINNPKYAGGNEAPFSLTGEKVLNSPLHNELNPAGQGYPPLDGRNTYDNPAGVGQGYPLSDQAGYNYQHPGDNFAKGNYGGPQQQYPEQAKYDPLQMTIPPSKFGTANQQQPQTVPLLLERTRLYDRPTAPQTVDFLAETRKSFPDMRQAQTMPQPGAAQQLPPGYQSDAYYQNLPNNVGWDNQAQGQYQPRSQSARGSYGNLEQDDPYIIDDYVVYGDGSKKHKITVPSPLQYEIRLRNQPETAKQRKFKEYVEAKRREDEDELKFKFRAKSVPKSVREPLYDKIIAVGEVINLGPRAKERRGEEELNCNYKS
jgi:hypothetical protein